MTIDPNWGETPDRIVRCDMRDVLTAPPGSKKEAMYLAEIARLMPELENTRLRINAALLYGYRTRHMEEGVVSPPDLEKLTMQPGMIQQSLYVERHPIARSWFSDVIRLSEEERTEHAQRLIAFLGHSPTPLTVAGYSVLKMPIPRLSVCERPDTELERAKESAFAAVLSSKGKEERAKNAQEAACAIRDNLSAAKKTREAIDGAALATYLTDPKSSLHQDCLAAFNGLLRRIKPERRPKHRSHLNLCLKLPPVSGSDLFTSAPKPRIG